MYLLESPLKRKRTRANRINTMAADLFIVFNNLTALQISFLFFQAPHNPGERFEYGSGGSDFFSVIDYGLEDIFDGISGF